VAEEQCESEYYEIRNLCSHRQELRKRVTLLGVHHEDGAEPECEGYQDNVEQLEKVHRKTVLVVHDVSPYIAEL
jgi:hypothetical protein